MNDAQQLFAKMYENVQGAAGQAGPDMSGMNMGNMGGMNMGGSQPGPDMNAGGSSDDVVDGDYREI